MDIRQQAEQLGLRNYTEFDPSLLVPEDRIRAFCIENKCGSYGKNYTCPPDAGTLEEIAKRLSGFRKAILLQYTEQVEVTKENYREILRTKNVFHARLLDMESYLSGNGITEILGMIGGNCGLCDACACLTGEPCRYPEKARMSLEAIGVDVFGLLDKLGLEGSFEKDRITWTGCLLYNDTNV